MVLAAYEQLESKQKDEFKGIDGMYERSLSL